MSSFKSDRLSQEPAALRLGLSVGLAVLFLAGLLCGLGGLASVRASPGVLYVASGGNCGGAIPCLSTVQAAVDAAQPGDEIRVAAGIYTNVNTYGGLAQVVYISKTVTLRGGYTITNWTVSEPVTNTTILNAEELGRVIYITGTITPTIEGLHIIGGDATDVGNRGGGICSVLANPVIAGNVISGNVASTTSYGRGGGIYLEGGTPSALITGNQVLHNMATTSAPYDGHGGGLYLNASAATVYHVVFSGANHAE